MKALAVSLACVLSLSACTTQRQNATTGESETNSATTGAFIGAIAGAVVGVASSSKSDRGKGALIGAASGAAIGGGTGYYLDQQEKELRESLLNSGVQVKREGDNQLSLIMQNGIGFATNSYQLDSSIRNTLAGVATILVEYPKTSLVIEGYTDSTGSDSTNQVLSERRAEAVRQYLLQQGVAPGRAVARGLGERFPICSNETASGRACNRRVEINILPLD